MKIKAAVMRTTGGKLSIEDINLSEPKHDEVLVQIKATGVCHSDLNSLEDATTPLPTVLGHEGAGIVHSVGSSIKHVKPGDRVVLSWAPYCGQCAYCAEGKVHLCEDAFGPMFAGTLLDGTTRLSDENGKIYHSSLLSTFAEYAVVPAMSCIKIPDEMPFAQASLIGCGVSTGYSAAVNAAGVTAGSTVAVFGIGGVGINAIQGAKIAGASKIIACDIKDENLEIAKKFGATHVVNCSAPDTVEQIQAITDDAGVHFAIDCSGNTFAAQTAWLSARKGATVVVVGAFNPTKELSLPAGGFHRLGKVLRGSFYGDASPFRDFPRIAQMYLDHKFMLDELVIKTISIDEINEAFDAFHDHNCSNVGRTVITFD
ncbi:zinc-binding alcohol dehydrogenase [Kurthia sibirica]|uniref:Zinc-binding alcohol dehydrogenase n=2 Tax=Kurthia sibirica TaxID=202750 RepID=A0A2U3AQ92_9BACL|nr:zinc-binding alcohol dehydrogenase [Kurthia sibirica]